MPGGAETFGDAASEDRTVPKGTKPTRLPKGNKLKETA